MSQNEKRLFDRHKKQEELPLEQTQAVPAVQDEITDLHNDMIKWSDNSDASQWYYLDVLEATNSHYYQTKENQFEKWTELRDTRDWTELEK